jgi:vancomycin resistance protein YoaR
MRTVKSATLLLALFGFTLLAYPAVTLAITTAKNIPNQAGDKKIIFLINDQREELGSQEFLSWFNVNLILKENPRYRSEIENTSHCNAEAVFCELTRNRNSVYDIQKTEQIEINDAAIDKYLQDLANQVKKDPGEARFKIEEGKVVVFSPSQEGLELDLQKSKVAIVNLIKNNDGKVSDGEISLAYKTIEPINNIGDLNSLNINDLLGEGKSNFRGSPKNRIFNINVATEKFNGILIPPGEEFSFVKNLGLVDGEHGYLPELVIKKDKTEPEFGGGICQVSTTTFRAAIYSGLKITARRNHAYPVSYYNPQGMDATVYVPWPDLRFINNTPGYILIQTKIEGTILTFDFWGTNDGRKTEVNGPWITERNPDGSMKTEFGQKVTNSDGNVIIDDTFKSNYDSPSKYPHPGQEITEKPKDWSKKQWEDYKTAHNMN